MVLQERKDNILLLISYASLLHNDEPINENNISAEKTRIERIAESFYISAKDQEYNSFMINWLKENADDIVYTDKFIYDVNIPDEQYELNSDLYCRRA